MGVVALTLCACGGGGSSGGSGDGGGAGAPSPTGPAPGASPTLSAYLAGSDLPLVTLDSFAGIETSLTRLASDQYRLTRAGQSDAVLSPSGPAAAGVRTFAAGPVQLREVRPSGTDYSLFGTWLQGADGTLAALNDGGVFYGGLFTPVEGVPASGQASYAGSALALETLDDAGAYNALSGDMALTADFAARTVAGRASLRSGAGDWGAVETGTLALDADGTFSGSATTSTRGHTGLTVGNLFGPGAREIAGTFELTGPSTLRGAFGASLASP